jgi:hypothetical protein
LSQRFAVLSKKRGRLLIISERRFGGVAAAPMREPLSAET